MLTELKLCCSFFGGVGWGGGEVMGVCAIYGE